MLAAALAMALPVVAQGTGQGLGIAFARASLEPAPGFRFLRYAYGPVEGRAGMFVDAQTVITDPDFEHASVAGWVPSLNLLVRFTPEAYARLHTATAGNIGGYFATLVDSLLVSAPVVRSPVGGSEDRSLFLGLPVPDSVAQRIAARVRARWPPRDRHDCRERQCRLR